MQAPDVMVHVLAEPREYLHHAGIELALVGRQLRPVLHVGVVPRQLGVLGHDAKLLLLREHPLAIGVPAVVELALVLVGPLLRHVMGGVVGAGREVEEERLVGRHLLQVGDEAYGLVRQVLRQVIAFLRRLGLLDLMIVVDEIGIVLMRVAAEEAVVALEAASQRPAVVGAGRADLLGRGQVPLADAVGRIAVLQQRLRHEPVLERDGAIAARVAGRSFGDAGHTVGMVVAARQHAGARRRAQCGSVHVREQQAVLGEPVDVGRVDRPAVATELTEAGVVQHDEQDVGRVSSGAQRRRPCRLRLADRAAHAAGERRPRLVFLQRHCASPARLSTAAPSPRAGVPPA